jgi:hypothetical protein
MRLSLTAATLTSLVFPALTYGQVLSGRVRDESTNEPLRGAFVALAEAGGRRRVAALTDAEGRFTLRAGSPGQFQLSTQLIGYALRQQAVSLAAGETRTLDLALTISPVPLAQLSVRGDRRCGANAQGAETVRLWEEARKALSVAAWFEQDTIAWFRVRSFQQKLSSALVPLADEEMSFELTREQHAFETAPIDSLIAEGFVQMQDGQHVFFGPDAAVLTADAFLEHHCFRVERSRDRPGLVGLAFEPLRGRRVSDIRGELWLDERTGALRFVDYGFVNLGVSVDRRAAGGRTEYQRLPNGAWIVSRWEIRMPEGNSAERGARLNPEGVERVGGEVLDVRIPGSETTVLVPSYTLRGVVYDSLRDAPLARARVYLPGTPLQGYTDDQGDFRIDSVPRGTYYVTFAHVRLDSIPAKPPLVRVRMDSTTSPVRLATPDPARLRAMLCSVEELTALAVRQTRGTEQLGVLRTIVRDDETGAPVKGVKVSIDWQETPVNDPVTTVTVRHGMIATSNENGETTICGVPIRHQFRVMLTIGSRVIRGPLFTVGNERVLQFTVRIKAAQR